MTRAERIEAAAVRVLDAFSAYGKARGVVKNARGQQACEAAMTELAAAVDESRYTITEAGKAYLEGRK